MKTNQFNRQTILAALVDLGIEAIGTDNGATLKLPQGTVLLAAKVITATAFDSGTTATITVSDGTTSLIDSADLTTAGTVNATIATPLYPQGATITVSLAQTGTDATAGRALVLLEYVQLGVGTEVYG